jgi:O-antigen/teichoic acid export membrane protein
MAKTGALLIKGGLLRVTETLVQMVTAFIMMPLMIGNLGEQLYGVWAVVINLIASYHLLDLGFAAAVTRFVARHISSGDNEETNGVVSTAIVIYSVLGLVILLITLGSAVLSERFVEGAANVTTVKAVILLCGLSMALEFPFKAFAGITNAYLRYDLLVYSRLFFALCSAFSAYWLLTHGFKLVALATSTLIISIASNVVFYAIAKYVHRPLRVSRRLVTRRHFKELSGYSVWSFLSSVAQVVRGSTDNMIVAGFLSARAVTHYSVGQRLSEYAVQMQMQATNTLAPLFTRYHARGDTRELHDKVVFMTKINTLLAVFCCWMLMLVGDVFIRRWIGPGFGDSYRVLCLLAVGFGATLTFNPLSNAMYAIARLKGLALMEFVEAGIKFALSIWLVQHYGLYGVALGTVIPLTLFALVARPWIACQELQMPLRRHYAAAAPFIVLGAALVAVTLYWVQPMLPVSYLTVVLVPLLFLPPFLWISVNFLFDDNERRLLLAQVPQSLQSLARALLVRRLDLKKA